MKRRLPWIVLGVAAVLAAIAPWIAPAPGDLQEDVAGARLLRPGTRADAIVLRDARSYVLTHLRRSPGGWIGSRGGRVLEIADADVALGPAPRLYALGTDSLGRDLVSRLLFALRQSMLIATLSVLLSLVLGVLVGASAGLGGRWTDAVLMRGVDVLLAVPRLLLFLLLAALFRPSLLLLVVVLGGTTWPSLARLVRAEILARRGSDLVAGARAAGCSLPRTVALHLLPQIAPLLAVTCALRFADTVVLEAALSFLGLGAPPPAVSLGGIIAMGREDVATAWWVVASPVIVLSILVMALRSAAAEAFDPPSIA